MYSDNDIFFFPRIKAHSRRGALIAQLGERLLLIARSRFRSSLGSRCCVIEQESSSPLLSTCLTQETVPN